MSSVTPLLLPPRCDGCALLLPPPLPLLPLPPLLPSRCLLLSASSQVLKRGSSGLSGWPSCFSFQSLPATCNAGNSDQHHIGVLRCLGRRICHVEFKAKIPNTQ